MEYIMGYIFTNRGCITHKQTLFFLRILIEDPINSNYLERKTLKILLFSAIYSLIIPFYNFIFFFKLFFRDLILILLFWGEDAFEFYLNGAIKFPSQNISSNCMQLKKEFIKRKKILHK